MTDSASKKRALEAVFFVPTLDGGLGMVTTRLAEGFKEKNINTEVWSLTPGHYSEELESIVTVRYLKENRAIFALWKLRNLLRHHHPKTLLSASYHTNCVAILARFFAHKKIRLVIAEHTSLTNGLETIRLSKRIIARVCIRLLYKYADAWVAVSKETAKQMAHLANLHESKVKTIYNPVINEEIFKKSQQTISHPFFSVNEPILLSIGRLSAEKDFTTLLKAMSLIVQKMPARLIIVGDGPEKNKLQKLANRLNLVDRISFVGHVSNPYPYYKKADVFVLSSQREGLPTVLIEALALGTKVVSTDARSGPREILKDGEYGSLVPIKNAEKLASSVIKTLQNHRREIPPKALSQYESTKATNLYLGILHLN